MRIFEWQGEGDLTESLVNIRGDVLLDTGQLRCVFHAYFHLLNPFNIHARSFLLLVVC